MLSIFLRIKEIDRMDERQRPQVLRESSLKEVKVHV